MNNTIVRSSLAALALAGMLATATAAPARADGAASTRTIIAGLAAAAAIATIVNVDNKNAEANRVVGYLQDGSTVYADGRVVARNGYAWYPGNNGQTVSCNGQQCYLTANNSGYTSYNNGYNGGYNSGYSTYGYGGGYAAVPVYGSVNIYSGSSGYSSHRGENYARNAYGHGANDRDHNTHWNGNTGHGWSGNAGHGQPGGQQHGNGGDSHGGGSHSGGGHWGNGQHS